MKHSERAFRAGSAWMAAESWASGKCHFLSSVGAWVRGVRFWGFRLLGFGVFGWSAEFGALGFRV